MEGGQKSGAQVVILFTIGFSQLGSLETHGNQTRIRFESGRRYRHFDPFRNQDRVNVLRHIQGFRETPEA